MSDKVKVPTESELQVIEYKLRLAIYLRDEWQTDLDDFWWLSHYVSLCYHAGLPIEDTAKHIVEIAVNRPKESP